MKGFKMGKMSLGSRIPKTTPETLSGGFRTVLRELRTHKRELITLSILGIISALASALHPFFLGRLFDTITGPSKTFFVFLSIWFSVSLISSVITWRSGIKSESLSATISSEYIVKSFSKVIEMPLSFHKQNKIGSVTHIISRAANSLDPIVGRVLMSLAPSFLSIFVALIICFYVNYKMSFLLLGAVSIYMLILIKKVSPITNLSVRIHRAYMDAYGNASDAIINIQPVKQATAEKYEKERSYKSFLTAIDLRKKIINIWNSLSFYQSFIVLLTQTIIFSMSLYLMKAGSLTLGELVMFNSYSFMLFGPFYTLGNYWQLIQNGLTAISQVEKILKMPSENYSPKNAVVLQDIKGDIKFENLNFYYKQNQKILEDINFEINSGEIIALVGKSGVGKSTLVDLISGYYFPITGKILIDGHNIKKLDLTFLRNKIGVVPQELLLFNDTVKNNIKYGNFNATDDEIHEAAQKAHADEFIENFPKKYNQIVGERGVKLSAGQKQRIAIARAVLRNPKILVLDEPTSSLDADSEKYIQESLEKLMEGRTTIIIAHRLSTVRKADKIIVFDKGHVVDIGTHDELIAKDGVYRHLYELQFGVS